LSLTLETASAAPVTAALPEAAPISSSSLFSRLRNPLLAVIFPGAMVIVWHLATYGQKYSLIPPPSDVALALWDLAFGGINDDAYSKTLHIHLLASLSRVYGGFAIALSVALPLGLLIGRIALIRRVLDPRLPLAMIMFGLGPRSAFFLVCLGAFYPILINTIFGVRTVDQRLFEAASMLGCQGTAQFFRVVLPASLPAIFTGLRLGLGFAWVVIVVGEMTGVQTGLGAIIMEARQLSRTEIVICGMVVIGVAGFISDRIVVVLGKRLLRWSPSFA
jgi:NitT/TauT family transport system permease protein